MLVGWLLYLSASPFPSWHFFLVFSIFREKDPKEEKRKVGLLVWLLHTARPFLILAAFYHGIIDRYDNQTL